MKYFYYTLGALFFLYAAAWTFNHVNPWIAILLVIGAVGFLVSKVIKFIKNNPDL